MAVDENGKQITGEMVDYRPDEMTLCKHPANGQTALVRMSVNSQEQADALRAQGVAAEVHEPEPSWFDKLVTKVTKSLKETLGQTTTHATKGQDDMSDDTQAAAVNATISEADWAKIDEKIKAACEALKAEIAPATDANADKSASTPAAEAPPAAPAAESAPADKSAPALLDVVQQLAQNQANQDKRIAEQNDLLKGLLNTRSTGNQPPGDPPAPETTQTDKSAGVWTGSHLAFALQSVQ